MPNLGVVLIQFIELALLEEQNRVPIVALDLPELPPDSELSVTGEPPYTTHLLLERSETLPSRVRDEQSSRVVSGLPFSNSIGLKRSPHSKHTHAKEEYHVDEHL